MSQNIRRYTECLEVSVIAFSRKHGFVGHNIHSRVSFRAEVAIRKYSYFGSEK